MNFSKNKIFNLKICWIKPFISGFGPNPIEHWAKTGRLHCLLQPYSCVAHLGAPGGSFSQGGCVAKPRRALLTVPPWKHRGYLLLIRRIRSSRLNKTKSPWRQADSGYACLKHRCSAKKTGFKAHCSLIPTSCSLLTAASAKLSRLIIWLLKVAICIAYVCYGQNHFS